MVHQHFQAEMDLGPQDVLEAIAETAGALPRRQILEDVTLTPLTYRRLMVGAELLAQQFQRLLPRQTRPPQCDPSRVGVLLPNVNGMPVTLLALWSTGHTPAVLNFSTGPTILLQCARLADIRDVITSRTFLEKAKLDIGPLEAAGIQFHMLEDIRTQIRTVDKLLVLMKHSIRCGMGLRSRHRP
jgi:acyl-[acyl-carrier-protein]-phospholipid O-acyltransferase/long-chain-fatty-acid--[acyl-carrier-protein] ligase